MPIEQIGTALPFRAFYSAEGIGSTGLTVTIDVYNPAGTKIVTDGVVSEVGGGLYLYTLSSGLVLTEGEYIGIFKTADTSVDVRQMPATWVVGRAGIELLDAVALLAIEAEPSGSITIGQLLRTVLAVVAGRTEDGGLTFKTPDGVKTRAVAIVNSLRERTDMTLTPDA